MMATGLLRAAALAIAIAGLVDPVFSVARRETPPVAIVVLGDPTTDALQAAERVRRAIDDVSSVSVRVATGAERAAACPSGAWCVLVHAAGMLPRVMGPGSQVLGALVFDAAAPALRITQVEAPAEQHPLAAGRLHVQLAGAAVRTGVRIEVRDGDALVGAADVPPGDRETVGLDVPWWPLSSGPRPLSVDARSADGHGAASDIGVNVTGVVHGVVVYDARPSWASTFVRRAVESDPRFGVRARSRLGPDLFVANADAIRLDTATLERASVVIVGGPDALTSADVEALDKFVRVRGGSLILLPDRALSGPVARLVPPGVRERLEREPLPLGPLRAAELLVAKRASASHALLSTADGDAAVIATPAGEGRIIFSGATDAWRYRASDDGGFDGFWRSIVADAAGAAGHALDVTASPTKAAVGDDVRIALRIRSMADTPTEMRVSARVACNGQPPEVVRLWPSGRGTFAGTFAAARAEGCRVRAEAFVPQAEEAETAFVAVAREAGADDAASRGRIEALAATFDAPVVRAGDEQTLASAIRGRVASAATDGRADLRPMRSPWWIVGFVGCLGGEWWFRRRKGLR